MQRDGEWRLWSAQYSLSLLLLLPPTAWGIPVGCGDPRTAAAWVLCRGCSPSGVGCSSVGAPQAPCSYCQKSCSRLLLPWYSTACREMSCFTDLFSSGCGGIQWGAHSASIFFSSSSSSSSHLVLTVFSHALFPLLPGSVFPFLTPLTAVELHYALWQGFWSQLYWHLAALASPHRGPCSPVHTPREQYHVPNPFSRQ